MKFDLVSLGDHLPNPHTGRYTETQAERFAFYVEQGIAAERLGFNAYWLGEHHCSDYIVSSPQMLLAAIAVQTSRIKLGTAVSLLPNNDPVRLAEDFATLDLLSKGRAQIGFGSGFTEHTFKLFGQDLNEVDALCAENLALLQKIWTERTVTWSGRFRAPIDNLEFQPRTFTGGVLPIHRATATSLDTARAAGAAGQKLMCMTVAGRFVDCKPVADAYREAYDKAGHDPAGREVAALAYIFLQPDGDAARETWFPYRDNYRAFTRALTGAKGLSKGIKDYYAKMGAAKLASREADFAGSPGEIVEKILWAHDEMGGFDRLIVMSDMGGLPPALLFETLEMISADVMPNVHAALDDANSVAAE